MDNVGRGTELSASYVDAVCHLDTSPSVSLCCQMVFPLIAFITIYSNTIGGCIKRGAVTPDGMALNRICMYFGLRFLLNSML